MKNEKFLFQIPAHKMLVFMQQAIEHVNENSAVYVANLALLLLQEPIAYFESGSDAASIFIGLSAAILSNKAISEKLGQQPIARRMHELISYFNSNPLNFGIDFVEHVTNAPLSNLLDTKDLNSIMSWITAVISSDYLYTKSVGGEIKDILHSIVQLVVNNPKLLNAHILTELYHPSVIAIMNLADWNLLSTLTPLFLTIGANVISQTHTKWDSVVERAKIRTAKSLDSPDSTPRAHSKAIPIQKSSSHSRMEGNEPDVDLGNMKALSAGEPFKPVLKRVSFTGGSPISKVGFRLPWHR
jgi:hypothetical protein